MDLLTEQAQDLVHTGSFRQVDIRGQTFFLVLADLISVEIIVDIAGDHIGIASFGARFAGNRQSPLAGHAVDSLDQFLRISRFSNLPSNLTDLGWRKRVVEPGKKRSEG